MNNFAENPQIEAPDQDFSLPTSQFDSLSNATVAGRGHCPVALADVRYSNGADAAFTQWLLQFGPQVMPLASVAYAGWNTGRCHLVWYYLVTFCIGCRCVGSLVTLLFSGKFSWNRCGQRRAPSSTRLKNSRISSRVYSAAFARGLALSVCCAAAVEEVRTVQLHCMKLITGCTHLLHADTLQSSLRATRRI